MPGTKIDSAGVTFPDASTQPKASTRQFFAPANHFIGAAAKGAYGDHNGYNISTVTNGAYTEFRVPNDFASLVSVKAIFIPAGTGTIDWTVTTDFGANGEAYNANSDSDTGDALATVDNVLQELDISAAFTGMAANDIVGALFILDAKGGSTTQILLLGLDIKYA